MDAAKDAAKHISKREKEIEHKIKEKLTVLWNELPAWQQDNHYIISGYRPATNSYNKSFASVGHIHNETVNIWSHMIGALLALVGSVVAYQTLGPRYESATREDVLVFSCYFLGAVACLGMSATYHTISNHSHEVAVWGNKLDYLGIVFLIWGSFIPVLYYGFQSEPQLMKTYAAMVSRSSCVSAVKPMVNSSRSPP
jgi:adiponectin receptor